MKLKILESSHETQVIFYCPGCKEHHPFRTMANPQSGYEAAPVWGFNGNLERPTFTPSLLCNQHDFTSRCHLFLTDGRIQFLSDCFHELAGRTVDLPDLSEGGVWDF